MSAIRLVYIICDSCGDEYDGSSASLAEVRKYAADDGWERRSTKDWHRKPEGVLVADVCPVCASAKAELS